MTSDGITGRPVGKHEPITRDEGGGSREFEYCGRGVCAAFEGHEGTCDEASGWVEPPAPPVPAAEDGWCRCQKPDHKPHLPAAEDDAERTVAVALARWAGDTEAAWEEGARIALAAAGVNALRADYRSASARAMSLGIQHREVIEERDQARQQAADLRAERDRLLAFAGWVAALDNPDPDSAGFQRRRTVTLTQITDRANAALSDTSGTEAGSAGADPADYGLLPDPLRHPTSTDPTTARCRTCGHVAVEHTAGRFSVHGVCPADPNGDDR